MFVPEHLSPNSARMLGCAQTVGRTGVLFEYSPSSRRASAPIPLLLRATTVRVLEYSSTLPVDRVGCSGQQVSPGWLQWDSSLAWLMLFFLLEFVQSPVTNRVTNDHLVLVRVGSEQGMPDNHHGHSLIPLDRCATRMQS